ncbi:MAG: Hsp20/alpha crystallin family protein [Deltaproteobacteria bacterium]|nr:MAG: Hsp20/alpha crystallin family protein [Deltaproteobacteria bacterium]
MLARRMFDLPGMGWKNAFAEMERMRREMDRLSYALFSGPQSRPISSGVFPALNITEDKDNYYVRAELPGMKADEINLQVEARNLGISGERKIHSEGENVKYHRREREAGKFARVIELPGEIDADNVDAHMVNGVLSLTIHKSEAAKPKQIIIKTV